MATKLKLPGPINILSIRGQRVVLDSDLAKIYGVTTGRFNEAVKRNAKRFPEDFMFQLTVEEHAALKSQIAILKHGRGQHRKYRPRVFTEHGALMAASVLNSKRAIAMSIFVIRAFVEWREKLTANAAILKRLAEIDRDLIVQDAALQDIYEKLLPLLAPPPEPAVASHRNALRIGHHERSRGIPGRSRESNFRPDAAQLLLKTRSFPPKSDLHVARRDPSATLGMTMKHFSVLDLAPIVEGGDAAAAFHNSLDLAQHAEKWGYHRFWLAEHHNIPGIASAATSVVIAHVAGGTKTIRVGAGGVMLPNHAPLASAEQFGTLESLFPGRIDLGLGRAPGSDQLTARAMRRNLSSDGDTFPQDLMELQSYFQPAASGQRLRAVPGAGLNVPIYLLGSSDFSARLAAELGLPFAFASHFAPDYLDVALQLYRRNFKPSAALQKPHAIIGVGVFAADTDAEAQQLVTSAQLQFLKLVRGRPGELPPPVESMDEHWTRAEQLAVSQRMRCSAIGGPATVRRRIEELLAETEADEIIATAQIYDHAARLRSFEIASRIFAELVA